MLSVSFLLMLHVSGVRIHDFHGNFFLRGTDLLALPGIDSDKSFAFELRNEVRREEDM